MSSEPEVFEQLRSRTADLLGFDLTSLTPLRALRLDRAVLLRLELDRLQAQQAAGDAVDLNRMALASQQLETLLPSEDDSTRLDLSLLSDEDLNTFETLIAKATGTAPPIEPTDEHQPDPRADLLTQMSTELDELRRANTSLKIDLEAERARVANLAEQKAAQPGEEADATRSLRVVIDNEPTYGSHWR